MRLELRRIIDHIQMAQVEIADHRNLEMYEVRPIHQKHSITLTQHSMLAEETSSTDSLKPDMLSS